MLSAIFRELEKNGSVVLTVKVKASASEDGIVNVSGKRVEVAVKKPAKNGAANKALTRLLARRLETDDNNVRIIKGKAAANKLVKIRV